MQLTWDLRFELKPNTWVFVPTAKSIEDGKQIKNLLASIWRPPKNYFHLRSGGHVAALKFHQSNTIFAHLDIQRFFGSINKSRVTRALTGLISYKVAREIATLSTVIHPVEKTLILPFGFVQSPMLASLCLSQSALGTCLSGLPKKYRVRASVYVDDIVLSGWSEASVRLAMDAVKAAAERSRFSLNDAKEQGPSPAITVFNIDLTHASIAVTADRFSKFIDAFQSTSNVFERKGIFNYINSISSAQAATLPPI
ncbi:MAG TPA: reverse transcriptase domain-containing protein [Burkholderiaceae bacterium]|nr:reverse transcriptase domain-containing protein [Burkholderiaceae bacterium]